MSEESDSSALRRDQTTQDFLTGLKERKDLENKLQEKERECNTLKGVIYDMTKKVEDLEKQVSIYPLNTSYCILSCLQFNQSSS